jgi:transcription antitermination factor NusG
MQAAIGQGPQWYVLRTAPRRERLAHTHLRQQGYTVRWLKFRLKMIMKGCLCEATRSLFPHYLFIQLDLERQGCHDVVKSFGVQSIVTVNNRPQPLPARAAEALFKYAMGKDDMIQLERIIPPPIDPMPAGTMVRIRDGYFEGLIGEVKGRDNQGRIAVLLQLLGADVPVGPYRPHEIEVLDA